MMRAKKLTNRGDTIVEVMIVLAVLGLALSICYATASRSLVNARQAQENAEATQLAISQIEQVRENSSRPPSDPQSPYVTSPLFCYNANDASGTRVKNKNGAREDASSAVYEDGCISQGRYYVAISYSTGGTFIVTVIWDSASGDGKDTVTMSYRISRTSP